MASRSAGVEGGFEADAEILAVLETVEQGHLIEEDRTQGGALGAVEATRGTEP
jgi:hypothetical protein